ncbi:hypothetical protein BU17DRAFT_63554 [Hysterangium stoloniferum]|nr:hypothetical protein BU17DRAFT_63554 [Hysterangium stoloniferum]
MIFRCIDYSSRHWEKVLRDDGGNVMCMARARPWSIKRGILIHTGGVTCVQPCGYSSSLHISGYLTQRDKVRAVPTAYRCHRYMSHGDWPQHARTDAEARFINKWRLPHVTLLSFIFAIKYLEIRGEYKHSQCKNMSLGDEVLVMVGIMVEGGRHTNFKLRL